MTSCLKMKIFNNKNCHSSCYDWFLGLLFLLLWCHQGESISPQKIKNRFPKSKKSNFLNHRTSNITDILSQYWKQRLTFPPENVMSQPHFNVKQYKKWGWRKLSQYIYFYKFRCWKFTQKTYSYKQNIIYMIHWSNILHWCPLEMVNNTKEWDVMWVLYCWTQSTVP